MKKSSLSLLLILCNGLVISAVLADPPFYKYPFLFDYGFDVSDNSYLALGHGESNPPRGTTYSDGKWSGKNLIFQMGAISR